MTVTLGASSLVTGQTAAASAVLRDAGGNVLTGRTITWASGSSAIATVSATGLVTAVGVGTTTIVATSEGQTGSALLTVTPAPVASVAVSVTSPLAVGQTAQASAVLRDGTGNVLTGRTLIWSSSASRHRLRVRRRPGHRGGGWARATITATSEGLSGTAPVTVLAPGDVAHPDGGRLGAEPDRSSVASRWSRPRRSS